MMMMDESVIVSSVISLLLFDESPHFSPLNGLERSKMVHGGLLSTVYVSDGLESSQFCLYTQLS